MKIGQYCQRQRCRHVELEQFWQAFASCGFVSDSWAFLFCYNIIDRCVCCADVTLPCYCVVCLSVSERRAGWWLCHGDVCPLRSQSSRGQRRSRRLALRLLHCDLSAATQQEVERSTSETGQAAHPHEQTAGKDVTSPTYHGLSISVNDIVGWYSHRFVHIFISSG